MEVTISNPKVWIEGEAGKLSQHHCRLRRSAQHCNSLLNEEIFLPDATENGAVGDDLTTIANDALGNTVRQHVQRFFCT